MKNILVPTDFSNDAYNALYYITQLLKDTHCTFHILNCYDEKTKVRTKKGGEEPNEKELPYALRVDSKEGLEKTKHRIVLDTGHEKHSFESISKNGDLIKTVGKLVKDLQIDLVVMGNKGVSGAKDIFMGSNTTKVIHAGLACPLLTIPKEIDFKIPKNLALVTDYKNCISAQQMAAIMEITKISGATIRVMHINEKERLDKFETSNMNTLTKYLEEVDHSFHWMPKFSSKTEAIQLFLEELGIDMLIMFHSEKSLMDKIFREPVIKKITFDIELPFLVINLPK